MAPTLWPRAQTASRTGGTAAGHKLCPRHDHRRGKLFSRCCVFAAPAMRRR